jgi:GT2 family glycosyltransferase
MQKELKPLVSIVTVNYNQSMVTCELLGSLRQISYPNIEIIVVDNNSLNDKPDRIKELFPEVQLIKSSINLGFAGGNNLGIKASKGSFILFLNNDIEVEPDFLEPLVEAFDKYPNAGIVSPKIKFFYHDNLIQYAGYTSLNPYTIRNKLIGLNQTDTGQFDLPLETAYAHGAGMMVRREIINEVGLMPEVYFLYYEEIDWSERIKAHGYSIYFIPQSVILHKESISTGKSSPLKSYYLIRNRIVFTRRNMKGLQKYISLIFQTFISTPKTITMHLLKGETKNARACVKGFIWHLSHPFKRDIL